MKMIKFQSNDDLNCLCMTYTIPIRSVIIMKNINNGFAYFMRRPESEWQFIRILTRVFVRMCDYKILTIINESTLECVADDYVFMLLPKYYNITCEQRLCRFLTNKNVSIIIIIININTPRKTIREKFGNSVTP